MKGFPSTTSNSYIIPGIILHWIWMILTLNFFSLLFPLSSLLLLSLPYPPCSYTYKNHTLFVYIQKPLMLYVVSISNPHIPNQQLTINTLDFSTRFNIR